MAKNIKSLDRQSAHLLRAISSEMGAIFTVKDAFRYLKLSRQSVHDRLSALAKGGWIVRLKRGVYFISPFEAGEEGGVTEHEFVIASHLVQPSAVGLWSALNHHGLTEQIPDAVYIVTTRKVSSAIKKIGASKYHIITVPKNRFFGTQEVWFGANKASITDLEKTIVDAFLHPQYCGGMTEAVKSFKNAMGDLDLAKLTSYAKKTKKGVVFKRMGILMDILKPDFEQRPIWLKAVSKGISLFDPQGQAKGSIISKWNIRLNFNVETIKP